MLSIGLSLGGTTGYAINPARDLGPRIAHAAAADSRQARQRLELRLGAGRRPAHRRGHRVSRSHNLHRESALLNLARLFKSRCFFE